MNAVLRLVCSSRGHETPGVSWTNFCQELFLGGWPDEVSAKNTAWESRRRLNATAQNQCGVRSGLGVLGTGVSRAAVLETDGGPMGSPSLPA